MAFLLFCNIEIKIIPCAYADFMLMNFPTVNNNSLVGRWKETLSQCNLSIQYVLCSLLQSFQENMYASKTLVWISQHNS